MQMTENNERQNTLDELYAEIKKHKWVVDTRGTAYTLIKSGTPWAKSFETMEAAIMFALDEIREGR